MAMTPPIRKLALTAHVTCSVGWIGAIIAFMGLAIVGLTSDDSRVVRAAYLAAEPIVTFVVVPLALGSLLTGLLSSLGSVWGLFRHYWVVFKLVINLVATTILLVYLETVSHLAAVAANPTADLDELKSPTFLLHAVLALLVLLVAVVLAVYKPRGMTRYGWRRQQAATHERRVAPVP